MTTTWKDVFASGARNVHFCGDCGSLLSTPSAAGCCVCPVCHATSTLDVAQLRPVVMKSIALQRKAAASRPFVRPADKAPDAAATVKEDCPECGHPELRFRTAQLRSADEGQTIFYECPNCGFKYSVNN